MLEVGSTGEDFNNDISVPRVLAQSIYFMTLGLYLYLLANGENRGKMITF